jgi:site-specific recombinase XerD
VSKAITPELLRLYQELELPERLIAAASTHRDEAFLSVLGKGGLPITEAVQLRVPNIDFKRESLSINNLRKQIRVRCPNCGEKSAQKYNFCPTCGNKMTKALREKKEQRYQRVIPIDCNTLGSIKRYLEWRRRFPYQGELLFPFSRQRGWQLVERLGRRIGLKGLHPESLRHLLAARWINRGLNINMLRFLMGYADTATKVSLFSFDQLRAEYLKLWES